MRRNLWAETYLLRESRKQGDKPNPQKRSTLHILFNEYEASFQELLQRNKEQTVRILKIHKLMTETSISL